ncbi:MAG: hypothetical protein HY805_03770 [Nitrospirae bacterium]|nr:hypothetical protein [Nitrospirota bacterium]
MLTFSLLVFCFPKITSADSYIAKETSITKHEPGFEATPEEDMPFEEVMPKPKKKSKIWKWLLLILVAGVAAAASGGSGGGSSGGSGGGEPSPPPPPP